jgi:pyruvate,water dikinase
MIVCFIYMYMYRYMYGYQAVYSCSLYTQFLGQFESYLFQKGESKVVESIKKCWCSCFSERVMSHRLDCGLPTTGLKMAVVIQVESVAQLIWWVYTCNVTN